MNGIASISSVGAVASRVQAPPPAGVSAPSAEPTTDVASSALKLIHALVGAGSGGHVLDLKG